MKLRCKSDATQMYFRYNLYTVLILLKYLFGQLVGWVGGAGEMEIKAISASNKVEVEIEVRFEAELGNKITDK